MIKIRFIKIRKFGIATRGLIHQIHFSFPEGDLKNKLKKGKLCMNNTKVIANSINHHDYRLDNDYINQNEDDTIRY